MKTLIMIFLTIRWIIAVLIVIFSLATFMNGSYGQTVCLILIAVLLVYWPNSINTRLRKPSSVTIRISLIVLIIVVKQFAFKSDPKTSIYRSDEHKNEILSIYEKSLDYWPDATNQYTITTTYGDVNILECGDSEKPPLVMLHAASMGAHSWAENLEPLLDNFHIFAIDNPGEGNKSELNNALIFPTSPKEVADLYNDIFDELNIDSAIVFGASNGGFIAQNIALYYPNKVSKMALFGPMGLTQLTNGSIAMMALSTMYPFQFLRNAVADWALGTAPVCHDRYGDWFNAIMKGTIPSIAQPVPLTSEEKKSINIPVILFLGSNDKIVGDALEAKKTAEEYPNIQIEILSSGHLIAVEQSETVNNVIEDFLKK